MQFLGIPKLLSWVAYGDANAVYKGLKEWPKNERPPVAATFWAFRLMVALGIFFVIVSIIAWFKRNNPEDSPGLLRLLMYCIPLPYVALALGWTVTEVGRQPWIVYGMMKTSDAASTLANSQVGISLAAFVIIYTLLGIGCFYLIARYAGKVPEPISGATQ